jgi:predicted metal-dependent hydrolase
MSAEGPLARGLRRVVDAFQRGLFDIEDTAAESAAPVPPADYSRHPRASREIVIDGQRIAFLLKRTRRRSIGFSVGAEGLAVSAPKWVALREIDAAVREKSGWILAKLGDQRERASRLQDRRIVWQDGAELMFIGQPIRIALDARHGLAAGEVVLDEAVRDAESLLDAASDETAAGSTSPAFGHHAEHRPRASHLPRRLHVGLPHDASEERIRDAVQSWLQREARAVFVARCAHFAAQLGVRVTRLSLSSAQTRWGSASASGAIRLHWRLIHFPMATIDYVVAHELAHLREMNHSPKFWDVVRSVVPEYEAARSELRSERIVALD